MLLCFSDDDGLTWSTPSQMITDAHYPTVWTSFADGNLWIGAVKFVSGSAAPCNIVAKRQGPGDAAMGSQFTFKDDAGADMEFEDDTFHVSSALDSSGRCVLAAVAYGSTDVSEWESFDLCATWTLIG